MASNQPLQLPCAAASRYDLSARSDTRGRLASGIDGDGITMQAEAGRTFKHWGLTRLYGRIHRQVHRRDGC
ncbi:MAG: hypothetical protein F4X93_02300 [Proteobacteria bacterium]|nr:hypothetical protein [Pseudomonadota bacterium]